MRPGRRHSKDWKESLDQQVGRRNELSGMVGGVDDYRRRIGEGLAGANFEQKQNWTRIAPMISYPAEIMRAVYTMNMIEQPNAALREVSKNRALSSMRRSTS